MTMHAMAIATVCIICTVIYCNELAYNASTICMQFQPMKPTEPQQLTSYLCAKSDRIIV